MISTPNMEKAPTAPPVGATQFTSSSVQESIIRNTDAQQFFGLVFDGLSGYTPINTYPGNGNFREDAGPVVDQWFKLPEQMDDMVAYVEANAHKDLYFCPYVFAKLPQPFEMAGKRKILHGRKKANAVAARVVYADADECDPDNFKAKPTIAVQTSPGRFHTYWLLDSVVTPEEASGVSKTIAFEHMHQGCDSGGWDIAQLLRVPGSMHTKRTPYTVNVADSTGELYKFSELDKIYPKSEVLVHTTPVTHAERDLLPKRVPSNIQERFDGKSRHEKTDKSNSDYRWEMILQCAQLGYTDGQILTALDRHPVTQTIREKNPSRDWDELELMEITKARHEHDHVGHKCVDVECPAMPAKHREELERRKSDVVNVDWDLNKPTDNTKLPKVLLDAASLGASMGFPVDELPGVLGEVVRTASEAYEVAPAMPAATVLSTISASLLGRVSIRNHGLVEPALVWTLGEASSGELKTVVQGAIKRWFEKAQKAMEEKYSLASHIYAIELADARSDAEEAKKDDSKSIEERAEALKRVEDLEANPVVPPVFVMSDATPEAFRDRLQDQNGRIALFTSEGSELLTVMGARYGNGKSNNLPYMLKAYNGETIDSGRAGNTRIYVKEPKATLGVMVQPEMLRDEFNKKDSQYSGLLFRFLMYVQPENMSPTNQHPRSLSGVVDERWGATVMNLVANTYPRVVGEDFEVTLDDAASELWNDFRFGVRQAKIEQRHRLDKEYLAKLPSYVLRIAAILHMGEIAAQEDFEQSTVVGAKTVQSAIKIMAYYYAHFLDMNDLTDEEHVEQDMRRLFKSVWTKTAKAGKNINLTAAVMKRDGGEGGLWRHIGDDRITAAMHRADELDLVTIQDTGQTPQGNLRMRFEVDHDRLKKYMTEVASKR